MVDELRILKNENERLLEELEEAYEQLQTTILDAETERKRSRNINSFFSAH
jgi:hypothetical protein